jgi:hypothetical protein
LDSDPYVETLVELCELQGPREALQFAASNGLDPTKYRSVWMQRACTLYQMGRIEAVEQLVTELGSVDSHLAINVLYGLMDTMNNRENTAHFQNLLTLCKRLQDQLLTADGKEVLELLISTLTDQIKVDEEYILELKARNLYRPLGRG